MYFSKDGSTALMCACEHGFAKVVKRLLAVDGCDASIADHVSYIIPRQIYNLCNYDKNIENAGNLFANKLTIFAFIGRQHVFFNCDGTQSKRHCFDDI